MIIVIFQSIVKIIKCQKIVKMPHFPEPKVTSSDFVFLSDQQTKPQIYSVKKKKKTGKLKVPAYEKLQPENIFHFCLICTLNDYLILLEQIL